MKGQERGFVAGICKIRIEINPITLLFVLCEKAGAAGEFAGRVVHFIGCRVSRLS